MSRRQTKLLRSLPCRSFTKIVVTRRTDSTADAASAVAQRNEGKTSHDASVTNNVPSSSTAEEMVQQTSHDASTAKEMVKQMIQDASIKTTTTKAGWCLREGLLHLTTVDNGRMFDLVKSQGPPSFYHSLKSCRHEPTDNIKAPENCFQSLCRIIAGQQLAGKAAQSIWKRLLETTKHNLVPSIVLELAGENGKDLEEALQKPAGLSKAKARSILDLAENFLCQSNQKISESFLSNPKSTEEKIRQALLQIKGLGPWSCDMFIMFHLEKPNIFSFGDLGVRKGVAKVFKLKGKGPKGSLCQKKDLDRANQLVESYRPYQSLFTYYMWRAADIQDVYEEDNKKGSTAREPVANTTLTPKKAVSRKRKTLAGAVVTP